MWIIIIDGKSAVGGFNSKDEAKEWVRCNRTWGGKYLIVRLQF